MENQMETHHESSILTPFNKRKAAGWQHVEGQEGIKRVWVVLKALEVVRICKAHHSRDIEADTPVAAFARRLGIFQST